MSRDRARRWYRRLLVIAPVRLRDRHADELEDAFARALEDARSSGRFAVLWTWLRALIDLVHARVAYARGPRIHVSDRPKEGTPVMIGSELRAAWRWLHRQRFATGLVVLMLALGIAANVVVFSLVNDLFLKPFPFPNPDRLVYVDEKAPRWNLDRTSVDYVHFVQWRKAAVTLEGIGLYDGANFNLSDEQGAERVAAGAVTYDFFTVLGVAPLKGRLFRVDEDRPGGPNVVILSERTWRRRFQQDPQIIGRTMRLNGLPFEIVGVMPQRAEFPVEAAFWIPLRGDPNQRGPNHSYDAIARAKPGVTVEQVEQDLIRAHQPIWDTRDKERIVTPMAMPLREAFVSGFKPMAGALVTAAVLLLVVACANVAAVMLARSIARRREIGIRLAVGANRYQLLRQLFIENVLISIAGGVLGLAVGRWSLRVLLASVAGDSINSPGQVLPAWTVFDFDWRIALFAVGLAAGTVLLFGWAPALHAVREDVRRATSDAVAGSTASPRGRRTLTWLVAVEFMLAAVLLVGTGLLLRAFHSIARIDPGYRPDHVLLYSAALPPLKYPDGPARAAFWDRALERLRSAPGVEGAGIITCPPLTCHWGNAYRIEGRPPLQPGEADPIVLSRVASDGYFEAMGLRLKSGRFFTAADGSSPAAQAVIVNETFARTFWPGVADVVGKRISFLRPNEPWITVVGVTHDIKHYGLDRPMRPGLYFPFHQMPERMGAPVVVIRTTGDPEAFSATARAVMRDLDPTLPLYRVQTAEQMLETSMRTRATYSWMLAVFAGITLLLALGGTYGVTSYLVTQRTREIGIRIAIGARASDITFAVFRSSLPAIAAGVVLGLGAAAYEAGQMSDLLFGVSPRDPVVLAGATTALVLTAALANWIPARRAARIDPVRSLRA